MGPDNAAKGRSAAPAPSGYWAWVGQNFRDWSANMTPWFVFSARFSLFFGPAMVLLVLHKHLVERQPMQSVFLDLIWPILLFGGSTVFSFLALRAGRRALEGR